MTSYSSDFIWPLTIQHTCFKSFVEQIWLEIWFEIPIGIQDKKLLDMIIYHEILNRAITIAGTSKCNKKTVSLIPVYGNTGCGVFKWRIQKIRKVLS